MGRRQNVSSDTIAVRIARALEEIIVSGSLEPGARLRQNEVATEFLASHVPVREAFRRLEAQGLVVSEPRRGVRVASFTLAEVKEVAEMRAVLEVLALKQAAPHFTQAILDQAETVLTPCGLPRLLATIDDLHAASARFLFATWRSDWEAPSDQDHRAILTALRQGQIDAAARVLERHVQWVGDRPVVTATGQKRRGFSVIG
jgi:DNA-binding GntR family transcriptional regulator